MAARIARISNPDPLAGGGDAEDPRHAEGRALATLWAHERLATAPPAGSTTLDQLPRSAIDAYVAPPRATTLSDFERLALDVPGTRVRRARAWAGHDPRHPGFAATGSVTVVVVPELPRGRPEPSSGLVRAVRCYLERRRTVGTRIHVVGPSYVAIDVDAVVAPQRDADPARLQREVLSALAAFLDPLAGGPAGLGWPFGRDVYRSELLALIDGVRGVDHVKTLEMRTSGRVASCSNICIGPLALACSGTHRVEASAS